MKTTAIDTNAILTYRLKREPGYGQVQKLFERCLAGKEQIFMPNAVFLECEWVLRSFYKQSKDLVIKFFQEVLLLDHLILKDKKDIELALNLYKNSQGINFTNCLILTQVQNYSPDEFLTFDENLQKIYQETL